MSSAQRKKSPRAPSLSLGEAIERALLIYEKEHRNGAPTDVIAQNLGYKSANNGAALSAIASLRYYGLLEKTQDGKLAVSKDVESYQYAPDDSLKNTLLLKWLEAPQIFAELLERYNEGLPSDASLRFVLIERGFNPQAAESLLGVFRKSVEYARYYERKQNIVFDEVDPSSATSVQDESRQNLRAESSAQSMPNQDVLLKIPDYDRIPVRLAGGRRAWLEIPSLFYSADKKQLKAQIDLLLAEDDEKDMESTE